MTDIVWQVNTLLASYLMCYVSCLLTNEGLGETNVVKRSLVESVIFFVIVCVAATLIVRLME